MLKEQFEKDGYVIIHSNLIENNKFLEICSNIYTSLEKVLKSTNIKKFRGYMMGNLNVYPGKFGDELFELIKENKILDLIENIIGKKISDMELNYGGNLCLSKKGDQHFHTDGTFSKEMYLVSIATENITEENGPTEVCVGTHKKNFKYWQFIFSKKLKCKILLNKGDIIIRKHCLWHRGTRNLSEKNRLLLSFVIFPRSLDNQTKPTKTSQISISSNFFKENNIGLLQEFIYSKLKFIHFTLRLLKSILSKS